MSEPEAVSDESSGGTTGCSTENPSQVAPPPFLDRNAVEAAITNVILGEFPKSAPMTAAQRDGWVEVLSLLHPGELRPALAARIDDKSYRPDAYAILEIVQGQRAARNAKTRRQIEGRRQAERHAEMSEPITTGAASAMRSVVEQFAHLRRPKGHRRPMEATSSPEVNR